MITVGTVWFVLATYLLMLAAYRYHRYRWFHVPVMATIAFVDVLFPFYLYLTHDWYRRLIVHQEIFSFLIWMHFGLVMTLYVLYFLQVQTARRIFAGNGESRGEHRSQANAILLVRGLVIITALMLVDPESVKAAALFGG
jgi:hypothetical protein